MKKLYIFVLVLGLMVSSIASAGTRLNGKKIDTAAAQIDFVAGTGEKEQLLANKIKVTALDLRKNHSVKKEIKPADPASHMYYFRTRGNGITSVDHVFGVTGLKVRLENVTDNVLVVHWNESLFQIGETSSMPYIRGMFLTDAGNPVETPNTIIPPKASVLVELYPAANVKRVNKVLGIQNEPISDTGTTKITILLKVEENGSVSECSYVSPCIDFPSDFVAANKEEKK